MKPTSVRRIAGPGYENFWFDRERLKEFARKMYLYAKATDSLTFEDCWKEIVDNIDEQIKEKERGN